MSGWGSGSYQQQKSDSKSDSRSGLSGTPMQKHAVRQLYDRGVDLSNLSRRGLSNIQSDPQQWFRMGQSVMPGGRYGLGSNVDAAVSQYGKDMFSQTSSDMAQRGFASPESQNAVIGSAIQNSLPGLIPQMMQFQQQQFMAPQTLLDAANTTADFWNRALGSRTTASGSSRGFGFSLAGGGGGGGGKG